MNDLEVMQAVLTLESIGYVFAVEDDRLKYEYTRQEQLDPAGVTPYFETIRANKAGAIEFITARLIPFDLSGQLLEAANKAMDAAIEYEQAGQAALARYEWRRYARLFAAGCEAAGADEPFIPWADWVKGFDDQEDPSPEYLTRVRRMKAEPVPVQDVLQLFHVESVT